MTNMNNKETSTIMKLAETAILAALCYVSFTFLQIKIPVPGGDATSLHIGNAFCVLAALLLGGVYGGMAGAVGMTIADLMDPVYITGAPKTFVLKLCIGLITGLVAHKVAKINESTDKSYVFKWSLIASVAGLAFNVVADHKVWETLPLPVMGLMSDAGYETIENTLRHMKEKAHQMGIPMGFDPFITLSFMALPVIVILTFVKR